MPPKPAKKGLGPSYSPNELMYGRIVENDAKGLYPSKEKVVDLMGDKMHVPIPPEFTDKSTTVVGSPRLGKTVERIYKLAPHLRGVSPEIITGPTRAAMDEITDFSRGFETPSGPGMGPEDYESIPTLGITDLRNKRVSINPIHESLRHDFRPSELDNTTAHELAHVAGEDEAGASMLGDLFTQAQNDKFAKEVQERVKHARKVR